MESQARNVMMSTVIHHDSIDEVISQILQKTELLNYFSVLNHSLTHETGSSARPRVRRASRNHDTYNAEILTKLRSGRELGQGGRLGIKAVL